MVYLASWMGIKSFPEYNSKFRHQTDLSRKPGPPTDLLPGLLCSINICWGCCFLLVSWSEIRVVHPAQISWGGSLRLEVASCSTRREQSETAVLSIFLGSLAVLTFSELMISLSVKQFVGDVGTKCFILRFHGFLFEKSIAVKFMC